MVGTSCSGKTTLARVIAARLEMPHVEMDALFWGPDWTPVATDLFRSRLEDAISGERWVMDGGYSTMREIIWSRADTVVWLDLPMPIVLGRWARRTVARIRTREEFWPGTGNRESLRNAFGRQSLLTWILTTHHRRRRTMADALAARPDLAAIRLRSPAEADAWLAALQPGASTR